MPQIRLNLLTLGLYLSRKYEASAEAAKRAVRSHPEYPLPYHRGLVDEGSLEVYYIGEQEGLLLIELPHQAMSRRWRVWVPKSAVA
jgi:hypothetical protein